MLQGDKEKSTHEIEKEWLKQIRYSGSQAKNTFQGRSSDQLCQLFLKGLIKWESLAIAFNNIEFINDFEKNLILSGSRSK